MQPTISLSTYDRLMQNPDFAEKFNAGYAQFLLLEKTIEVATEETEAKETHQQ